jgi:hypothetical protein
MRYATCNKWADYLRENEDSSIVKGTIWRKLTEAGKAGVTAKDVMGRICKNAFFSEEDVRSACADVLSPLPQSDEYGFFEKEGVRYGNIRALSAVLGVSHTLINRRLKLRPIQSIKGRGANNKVLDFYPEESMREICTDLLKELPQADDSGCIEKDGICYRSKETLSKMFGVSADSVKARLESSGIEPIKGKFRGQLIDFYSEPDVRAACAEFIKSYPRADENEPVKGKNHVDQIRDFYAVTSICHICADTLQDLPRADEDGFLEKEGVRYATMSVLGRKFNLPKSKMEKTIRENSIKPIQGKIQKGQIHDFYPVAIARSICESLESLPIVENGFIEQDGIRYRTLRGLAEFFGVSRGAIKRKIKLFSAPSIKGKSVNGRECDLYSESAIRVLISELIDVPQADQNGFFEVNGEKHGTAKAWSTVLPISDQTIKKRLVMAKKPGIRVRAGGGIRDFYSESAVRQACADLLDKRNNETTMQRHNEKPNPKAA